MRTPAGLPLRAAAYIRVSSEEQIDGHSLDAQRRAIEAACAERGWTIVAWYADEGVSAHTDDITKRPAFHAMVQDAQARQFDAVVVHKLDRFARSVVVALGTFKLLNDLGITFLSLSEQGMDFTSPIGKVMFGMLAMLAEYYSENLGLETRKGKAERKAKGLHNGLAPFGYCGNGSAIAEPDPATKDGAILAFQLAAAGVTLSRIAQTLNAGGYRTAGNMRRGLFTKDTVRDMLGNRFYLGKLPVFQPGAARRVREWQDGRHEPLIDEALFEAARTSIEGRATAARADRRNASVYSLSGLLRCAHCRERMRVVRTEKGRVRYHCRSKTQGLGCSGKGSFLDVYEEQVIADLAGFELPEEWQRLLLDEAGRDQDATDASETQRRQLETRLIRLKELYSWGDITREEYQAQRDRLDRDLTRLAPQEVKENRLETLATYLESLPAAWADATAEQRNRLASLIYEEICVNGPVVEYVKPRPELEPLFQVRTGATQPTKCLSHSNVGSSDPDGDSAHICQHYERVVRFEPPAHGRSRRVTAQAKIAIPLTLWPQIAARVNAGESLRALARDYGVSHECIRRCAQAANSTEAA